MTTFRPAPLVAALFLLPVATVGAPVPKGMKEELVKADLAKLEGRWRIVSYQRDGKEMDADELTKFGEVTFRGREFTWSCNSPAGAIDDIDPTQTPKRITYKDKAGKTEYGVYLLEGDVFTDCLSESEKNRPTEFTSKPDSGHTLIVYKRIR